MKLTVKKRITSSNETDAMTEPVLSPSDLVALLSKINELYDYEIRVMMDEAGVIWLIVGDNKYLVSDIEQAVLI